MEQVHDTETWAEAQGETAEDNKPHADKFEFIGVFGGTSYYTLKERIAAGDDERWFAPYHPGIYSWDDDEGGCWVAVDLDWQSKDRRTAKRAALDRAAELATKTAPLNATTFAPLATAIHRFLIQE